MAIHYLTVQDILWINAQITGDAPEFKQERVEEASYFQYAYGAATGIIPQAARLLSRFSHQNAFAKGNDATAFTATVAFLKLNGLSLATKDRDAADWFRESSVSQERAHEALAAATKSDAGHGFDPEQAAKSALAAFPQAIAALSEA